MSQISSIEQTYSDRIMPELKISLAITDPYGLFPYVTAGVYSVIWVSYLGTLAYALIICSEVAWKRSSGPVVPAAIGGVRCLSDSPEHIITTRLLG